MAGDLTEIRSSLLDAYGRALRDREDASSSPSGRFSEVFDSWRWDEELYQPDDILRARLAAYKNWKGGKGREEPGKLMEEIAYLAFRCLRGFESIKSYQSYAPQHDLVISGSDPKWFLLMEFLHLPTNGRTITIEAKNLREKVDDAQFSRLCGIIQNKFSDQCHLGVILNPTGATGFPEPGDTSAKRALRDAHATQVLFHALTKKYVVVLDHFDIIRLGEAGALPRILEAKLRHVEEAGSVVIGSDATWVEVDLPPHLSKYPLVMRSGD